MSDEKSLPTLGEMIRRQRELAALPMRQLAEMVGISNPYLSQIERNLREPSEQVLESIADHLQMSADALSARSRKSTEPGQTEVVGAIRRDKDLTKAQRETLEDMYLTLRGVTVANRRRGRGVSD